VRRHITQVVRRRAAPSEQSGTKEAGR